jgi:hypothetical protein
MEVLEISKEMREDKKEEKEMGSRMRKSDEEELIYIRDEGTDTSREI